MFPNIVSRLASQLSEQQEIRNKKEYQQVSYKENILENFHNTYRARRICGILFVFLYLAHMSTFYQVMGAVRCPKIKKHAGIKLRLEKKDPYMPRDVLIYSCESADFTQTIKCMDDGHWSELPHCPDPSNYTCPELPMIANGMSNSSGPHKVGSVVAFKCDTESFPNSPNLPSTFATTQAPTTTTSTSSRNSSSISNNQSTGFSESIISSADSQPLRYNLTGPRLIKCLPSSKWSAPAPKCLPIYPEPPSHVSLVITSTVLILVPILILIVIAQLIVRWRKRQQQRERWKQYFTDYKYRHSKTSITFGLRPNPNEAPAVPVTDL